MKAEMQGTWIRRWFTKWKVLEKKKQAFSSQTFVNGLEYLRTTCFVRRKCITPKRMVRAAKMCLEVSTNICDGIFWKSVSSHSFKRIARTSPKLTHHHFYLKLIWCQSLMTIWKPESPNSEFGLGASGGLRRISVSK